MGGYPEGEGKKKVLDGPPSLWTISAEPSLSLCLVHRRGSRYPRLPNTAIIQSSSDYHTGERGRYSFTMGKEQETNASRACAESSPRVPASSTRSEG